MEALVRFHAVGVNGDNRDMPQTGFRQRAADETDVVACAAATARLRHSKGKAIGVVLAGQHGFHHLPDGDDGRIAGVVVDEFEARVNGGACIVFQHDDMIPVLLQHRLKQTEMNR